MLRSIHQIALLLQLIVVVVVSAERFLTQEEVESSTCSSTFHQIVSRVTVSNPPVSTAGRIDILNVPDDPNVYHIECVEIFDSPPGSLTADDQRTCATTNPIIYGCSSPVLAVPQWSCFPINNTLSNPRQKITFGSGAGDKQKIKLQWEPRLVEPKCYPRHLTVMVIGHAPNDPGTELAASILFPLLVGVFALLAIAFGIYMLWKVSRKFQNRDKTNENDEDGERDMDNMHADASPNRSRGGVGKFEGDPEYIDFYEEQERKETVLDDGETVLESKPIPKPWFKRNEYDLTKRQQQQQGGVEDIDYDPPSGADGGEKPTARSLKFPSQSPIDRRTMLQGGPVRGQHQHQQQTPKRGGGAFPSYDYDDTEDGSGYSAVHVTGSGLRRRTGRSPDNRGGAGPTYNQVAGRRTAAGLYDDGIATTADQRSNTGFDDNHRRRGDFYDEYGPDEGEEEEEDDDDAPLTCLDCMLPVMDEATPKYCHVTGKRHR